MRVNPATIVDLRGMLVRPYYQRDHRKRTQQIRKSLARFCTLRSQPPPTRMIEAEHLRDGTNADVETLVPGETDHTLAVGIQTWVQWLQTAGTRLPGPPPVNRDAASCQCHQDETVVDEENRSARVAPQPMGRTLQQEGLVMSLDQDEGAAGVTRSRGLPKRRNPTRVSRPPVDIDLCEWGYFLTPDPMCGRIASERARQIKQGEGPALRAHPEDHKGLWCRESAFCPGANNGLFCELQTGRKRGHLIAVYEGESNDSLNITYQTAMERWKGSEYVLSNSDYRYVVNGDLSSGAARANESFGDANTFLYFNNNKRRVELRLAADLPAGFYEALVNYTPPHQASSFWTEDRILLLPEETRKRARAFYI